MTEHTYKLNLDLVYEYEYPKVPEIELLALASGTIELTKPYYVWVDFLRNTDRIGIDYDLVYEKRVALKLQKFSVVAQAMPYIPTIGEPGFFSPDFSEPHRMVNETTLVMSGFATVTDDESGRLVDEILVTSAHDNIIFEDIEGVKKAYSLILGDEIGVAIYITATLRFSSPIMMDITPDRLSMSFESKK